MPSKMTILQFAGDSGVHPCPSCITAARQHLVSKSLVISMGKKQPGNRAHLHFYDAATHKDFPRYYPDVAVSQELIR